MAFDPLADSPIAEAACSRARRGRRVRSRTAGVLAVARTVAKFLNGQLSAETETLPANACRYTASTPEGPDARELRAVARSVAARSFLILLPADVAPSVAKRLSMYVLRSKVALTDVSIETALLGVEAPTPPGTRRRVRRGARALRLRRSGLWRLGCRDRAMSSWPRAASETARASCFGTRRGLTSGNG
jgi:hypothetical protein